MEWHDLRSLAAVTVEVNGGAGLGVGWDTGAPKIRTVLLGANKKKEEVHSHCIVIRLLCDVRYWMHATANLLQHMIPLTSYKMNVSCSACVQRNILNTGLLSVPSFFEQSSACYWIHKISTTSTLTLVHTEDR